MLNKSENKIHYAWWILAACCLMQFGGLGAIMNTGPIFLPHIKENLGFTTGEYSTYVMFQQFAQALMLPISGKIISNAKDNKAILLASIGVVVSNCILVLLKEPWQWYIAGTLKGISGAFLFMTLAPMILNRWFKKKTGFAVGMASAFSGIGGAILSPIGTYIIDLSNWQVSMFVLSIIAALSMIPTIIFVLKLKPEYLGLTAYGATENFINDNEQSSISTNGEEDNYKFNLVFILVIFISILLSFAVGFNGHTVEITRSLGLTTMAGSFVVSATMFGNIFFKLLIGWMSEKFSSYNALLTTMVTVMLGLAGYLLFGKSNLPIMLISGFLYGGCMSLNAVGIPILVRHFYTGNVYNMVLSYSMMFSMMTIGIAMTVFGNYYDNNNTYLPLMVMGIIVYLFMALIMTVLYKKKS